MFQLLPASLLACWLKTSSSANYLSNTDDIALAETVSEESCLEQMCSSVGPVKLPKNKNSFPR